jgi:hypothetical protein
MEEWMGREMNSLHTSTEWPITRLPKFAPLYKPMSQRDREIIENMDTNLQQAWTYSYRTEEDEEMNS